MNTKDLKALLAHLGWEVVGIDVGVHAYYHPDLPGVFVDMDDESTRLRISVEAQTVRDVNYTRIPIDKLRNMVSKYALVLEKEFPSKRKRR